jgi:histidinol-phosphate aminotransferase
MSGVLDLVREDLRGFAGYASARSTRLEGEIWLNANESAWPNPGDAAALCRRYPEPQPQALRERLAALFGCRSEQLLIGRGSDEAIDLLVRARPRWRAVHAAGVRHVCGQRAAAERARAGGAAAR